MSILIKGMKMPETCEDCPLQHSEYLECKITGESTWDWENAEAKYKSVNCPLVELPPHGRLIDAEAFRQAMYHEAFETDSPMQKWDSGCWIRYKMFERMEEVAPTIIEAEGTE